MWSNVIGQDRIKKVLRQTVETGKLPSAYLFSGTEGVGKDAAAIELAKTLNCHAPVNGGTEACDECANCRTIGTLQSPLITFVHAEATEQGSEKDKDAMIAEVREQRELKAADPYHNIVIPKATRIRVDQIRDLRIHLAQTLVGGKKRVIVVSEADMMESGGANAFLKTLEEPNANTLIVLTSSISSKLLPTIHSRTQELRFDLLTADEISEALQKRDGIDKKQSDFLARLAGGSYSAGRNMVDADVAVLREQVVQLLLKGLSRSNRATAEAIDAFLPRSGGGAYLEKKQTVEQLLHLLSLWLRDALAIASGSESYVYNVDQIDLLKRFSTKYAEPARILRAHQCVDKAKVNVRLQLQLRAVIMTMVVEMGEALMD